MKNSIDHIIYKMSELEKFRLNWGLEISKKEGEISEKCCCVAIKKFMKEEIHDINKYASETYRDAINRSFFIPNNICDIIYGFMGNLEFDICRHCGINNCLEYKEVQVNQMIQKFEQEKPPKYAHQHRMKNHQNTSDQAKITKYLSHRPSL
jgi:hypothetical protein